MKLVPKNIPNVQFTEHAQKRRKYVERGLRYIAAEAVSDAPAKVVAAEAGISEREVHHLRTATRNPQLGVWYELLRRRPDLRGHVEAVTAGLATSEQIDNLIRFLQAGGLR